MDLKSFLPVEIANFMLVLIFSLLIGLSQRSHHKEHDHSMLFGTDRTFSFIGLLGFVLFIADPKGLVPFLTGFVILGIFMGIQYFMKIQLLKEFGLTSSLLALLTYCIAFLVYTQPEWLVLSFVVSIFILTEMKDKFKSLSEKTSEEEFITLGVFIAIAGVILPLLPEKNISGNIPVSPYNLWLAIVVVSAVSYLSYLIKKFIFPESGILLTGILGGIYSSTATTVILARREKEEGTSVMSASAILLASSLMYLRILVLVYIFNSSVGRYLTLPFLFLAAVAFGISKFMSWKFQKTHTGKTKIQSRVMTKNPLEMKTAIIFGVLFVIFGLITDFVMKTYGSTGVTGLAFIVGIFDVDPFLLFLVQQNNIEIATVALAIINATNSNNLMKMFYAISLGSKSIKKPILTGFISLFVSGIIVSAICYLIWL
jgi:uncharacterized membrane protein (DUF4010 family)